MQFSIRDLVIFTTVFSVLFALPAWVWRDMQSGRLDAWGPNPGYVEYSIQHNGKHEVREVRDLDNAKQEVEEMKGMQVNIISKEKHIISDPNIGSFIFLVVFIVFESFLVTFSLKIVNEED